MAQAQASACKLTMNKQNWPKKPVSGPKAQKLMMLTPSQSQNTKRDHHFEKDQTKMFLQQCNTPPPQPFYNRDLLNWILPESIVATMSPHTHPTSRNQG